MSVLTAVRVLVMGASADHLGHVLRLLVNRCGPEESAGRRVLADQHFNRARLGKLAI